ncbi:MAG: aldehyde dehydrogenase [Fimbriimonadaceae bacterium]|nr:aldehyde dehydrogenase [Fimbriimonadaceae bacterium]
MAIDERQLSEMVEKVVRSLLADGGAAAPAAAATLSPPAPQPVGDGVFSTPSEAIQAAERSLAELAAGGLGLRRKIVEVIRQTARANAEKWAQHARAETGMGYWPHKVLKNLAVANGTPGVEDLEPRTLKGDAGTHIIDGRPWGIICAITPSTNPTATVINNGLAMIAAGNTVVFCPHPSAKESTKETMVDLNRAIVAAGLPANLMCTVAEPTLKNAAEIMKSERIRVIAATGGPGVVRAAMDTGKKVFAAGPGNPPVVVDATADLARAGASTVKGSSFDNNLPCVAEKVAIAESRILDDYVRAMERHGAQLLTGSEIEKILPVVLDGEHPRRESIGQDATELLRRAGLPVRGEPRLIVAVLPEDHPLVIHEQMMPFLPVVRVRDFDDALRLALQVEHGFGHTAILHSQNTTHIDRFIATMGTTITVINGPSYAFSGDEGEGYATMTVTTPTGEGVTSPRTWQRRRHLCYSGMLYA